MADKPNKDNNKSNPPYTGYPYPYDPYYYPPNPYYSQPENTNNPNESDKNSLYYQYYRQLYSRYPYYSAPPPNPNTKSNDPQGDKKPSDKEASQKNQYPNMQNPYAYPIPPFGYPPQNNLYASSDKNSSFNYQNSPYSPYPPYPQTNNFGSTTQSTPYGSSLANPYGPPNSYMPSGSAPPYGHPASMYNYPYFNPYMDYYNRMCGICYNYGYNRPGQHFHQDKQQSKQKRISDKAPEINRQTGKNQKNTRSFPHDKHIKSQFGYDKRPQDVIALSDEEVQYKHFSVIGERKQQQGKRSEQKHIEEQQIRQPTNERQSQDKRQQKLGSFQKRTLRMTNQLNNAKLAILQQGAKRKRSYVPISQYETIGKKIKRPQMISQGDNDQQKQKSDPTQRANEKLQAFQRQQNIMKEEIPNEKKQLMKTRREIVQHKVPQTNKKALDQVKQQKILKSIKQFNQLKQDAPRSFDNPKKQRISQNNQNIERQSKISQKRQSKQESKQKNQQKKQTQNTQQKKNKDEHPLKQLRHGQSHGKMRVGNNYQSQIPNILPGSKIHLFSRDLRTKLRYRMISAITF